MVALANKVFWGMCRELLLAAVLWAHPTLVRLCGLRCPVASAPRGPWYGYTAPGRAARPGSNTPSPLSGPPPPQTCPHVPTHAPPARRVEQDAEKVHSMLRHHMATELLSEAGRPGGLGLAFRDWLAGSSVLSATSRTQPASGVLVPEVCDVLDQVGGGAAAGRAGLLLALLTGHPCPS